MGTWQFFVQLRYDSCLMGTVLTSWRAAQLGRWTAISTHLQFCLQQVSLQQDRMLHFQVDDLFDLARVPAFI